MANTTRRGTKSTKTQGRAAIAYRQQLDLIAAALGRLNDGLARLADGEEELARGDDWNLVGDATRVRVALEQLAELANGYHTVVRDDGEVVQCSIPGRDN